MPDFEQYLKSRSSVNDLGGTPACWLGGLPIDLIRILRSHAVYGVVPLEDAVRLGQSWWDSQHKGIQEASQEVPQEQIREREMTMMEKAKGQLGKTGGKLVDAGSEGLKLAGAKRVGRTLTKVARRHLGEMHPAIFDTEIGKRVEPMVIAAGVHYVLGMYPDKIPQAANLQRNCERIVTAEMEDVGGDLMDVIMPLLMELASSVPVLGETVEAEFAEEASAPKKTKK